MPFYKIYKSIIRMNLQSGQISETMSKVEIFLSARNLLDMDFFSKSDPYIKVYFKRAPSEKEYYLGKTETVPNNLNPNFTASFTVDYIFEAHQELRFELFDFDDGKNDDFLGSAHCSLGAVAGAKSQTLLIDIKLKQGSKSGGKLIIRLETCEQSNQFIQMRWRAVKLMNTDSWFDFWNKSDPYLKFIKIRNDNTFLQVCRTEVVQNNLNPSWKIIEIPKYKLVSTNNSQGRFKVQCWDWEDGGEDKHQYIGEAFMELGKLAKMTGPLQFQLANRKHKNPGKLVLDNVVTVARPTFFDYIKGGLELNLSIAIDFTASNGSISNSSSLHFMDPYKPNQYQMAINAVSRILLNYDTDKRIPCYAFGGKPHFPNFYNSVVNHCFPLSGNPNQIEAFGVEHLMELYNRALRSIELSGPTYFSFILEQLVKRARLDANEGSNCYQILLILTDGQIHDMEKTVNLLVQNCDLPLSIIIVGVGKADFENMTTLDGDNGLYSSQGKKAQRDIVQFVPFRDVGMNPDLLAKELLAELPAQVVQYMRLINKAPNPPIELNLDNMMMSMQKQMGPTQAMQAQVANIFQKANFFEGL